MFIIYLENAFHAVHHGGLRLFRRNRLLALYWGVNYPGAPIFEHVPSFGPYIICSFKVAYKIWCQWLLALALSFWLQGRPALQVPRGKTRLTVYRGCKFPGDPGTRMRGGPQIISVSKGYENLTFWNFLSLDFRFHNLPGKFTSCCTSWWSPFVQGIALS